jgi:hypothetical protein
MPSAQFSNWWQRFARTGNIEPLELGVGRDDVRRMLGEPDDFSLEKPGREPAILKYGELEFHFSSDRNDAELTLIYMESADGAVIIAILRMEQ